MPTQVTGSMPQRSPIPHMGGAILGIDNAGGV